MPSARVIVGSPIRRSPRVQQVEGLFDLRPAGEVSRTWEVTLPLEERSWRLGLIVGPSGCGKTTVARALFAEALATSEQLPPWPDQEAIVDAFPQDMPIKHVVELLTAVGFSSPPAWRRPYSTLSNGEQFRVRLARLLARLPGVMVVDEYTSLVDRTVARVGSAALARTVRGLGKQLVAITCHEDVEEWLQPDWVYRPDTNTFTWRLLQPRPEIELEIYRCRLEAWVLFRPHHYLSDTLSPTAQALLAEWQGRPVAFSAWVTALVAGGGKREHRTVTLPDYQGVGIGQALSNFAAALWSGLGQRVRSTTSHPALIAGRLRSGWWRLIRAPSLAHKPGRVAGHRRHARTRLTTGLEYIGPAMKRELAQEILLSRTGREA